MKQPTRHHYIAGIARLSDVRVAIGGFGGRVLNPAQAMRLCTAPWSVGGGGLATGVVDHSQW